MDIITLLSHLLGINTGALIGYIAIIMTICNLVGRYIPDTETGFLGNVRKVCKVVGLYLANRVAPGVSTEDASQAVIGLHGLGETIAKATEVKESIRRGDKLGQEAGQVINDLRFGHGEPGLPETTPGAPAQGSAVPSQYRTDPGRPKPPIAS